MDASNDRDWKQSVGFPINYHSDQSSGDDVDEGDVVIRHPHRHRQRSSSGYLLADGGDGAPADLLGTTPPRARIRNKEKRRTHMDTDVTLNRLIKLNRRSTVDTMQHMHDGVKSPDPPERVKKRGSLKILRTRERDLKMDLSIKGHRADSLPSPNSSVPAVPTLVESCNRFMSLTSKLKCIGKSAKNIKETNSDQEYVLTEEDGLLQSRVNFHDTFSMLIKMGNIDKTCRRTISLEEQVWQNELKDLIWLELQAKIGGRSLAQQDAFLCAQRDIVPTIVQNIIDYRFVTKNGCVGGSESLICYKSEMDDMSSASNDEIDKDNDSYGEETFQMFGCLSFNCLPCTGGIGKALEEVGTLLDSFYNAETLYPSSKVMAAHHPLIATQLFNNRLKSMCLWYNVALHMRMRILAVRRLILAIQHKACGRRARYTHLPSTDSDCTRSPGTPRVCMVRFDIDYKKPTDSNSSDSSSNAETAKDCEQPTVIPKDCLGGKTKQNCDISSNEELIENGIDLKDDADEVDCLPSDFHSDFYKSEANTPEVVVNDQNPDGNRNGTVDTTTSNESGYLSDKSTGSECRHMQDDYDVYNMGPLKEVIKLRLLKKCEVSPYRDYHYEVLKTQGVRRSMMFINKMRRKILKKVYLTFERIDKSQCEYDLEPEPAAEAKDDEEAIRYEHAKEAYELRRYGCWSPESLQMCLPSYRSHFLLLNTICMETVHDYLSLRLDTQPANPSCLTVKQLIHELKEGIDIATEMRNAFVRNIDAALEGYSTGCGARRDLQRVIDTFDGTLDTVVKQYLSYLSTMSAVEHMPRAFLEAEWSFSARLAQRMRCAAIAAPHSFTDIVCNQLEQLLKQYNQHFTSLINHEENYPEDSDNAGAKRRFVYALCREAQNIYASERERTIQTVQFARLLATRLRKNSDFLHCRERIFKALMCIRECIAVHTSSIVEKTRIISWEEELAEQLHARLRELLLQLYKLGFELHKELHKFVYFGWSPPSTRAPRYRPASLQPSTPDRHPSGRPKRPETIFVNHPIDPIVEGHFFHKELHRFVNDNSAERPKAHRSGAQRRQSSTVSPQKTSRPRFMRSESIGGEDHDTGVFDDVYLHSSTTIEYTVSDVRLDEEVKTGESLLRTLTPDQDTRCEEELLWCVHVSRAIIDFAKCWMKFVMERCDRGRGLRPRWASQGLEFLMLACDPYNTKHLSDKEFEELKIVMDACISHVIGSRPLPAPRADTTTPPPRRHHRHRSPVVSGTRTVPTPPSPPSEPDLLLDFNPNTDPTPKVRLRAIRALDTSRDRKLRELHAVGRVLEAVVTSYEPKLRQVTFKWQRGLKIGAGTFGKVYTVVNTESGQLLAMKELSIGAGDRRAMQRAANELQVLEGVIHPHLVRYYGCELHREEMLIFMELCVEGSLEALLATTGSGLPETQLRRYTKQLVSAVEELHARKIAHRDIKSGNIFLTNEGHCLKLGDFGCAVKIRANSTAAGELQGCVGTQAYMAPEVFMKSSGHGRAADIWSLGCVVTEMASGKRPFSEYDSNYQIMFVVGMGGRPTVPSWLSHEGHQFCMACLTHDPDHRPKAQALIMHHFLMVNTTEDDCNCEPANLITNK